ncbi:hypothetical protein [Nostocoides veronense]|uniref:Metal-dependent phosphohydrolase n=1 Tax=Nostocoides veronense TaxID=330836 RepID=A0ABP4Y3T2_9MICO
MDPDERLSSFGRAVQILTNRPSDHDLVADMVSGLLSRWSDPRRGYHEVRHLDEVRAVIATLADSHDPRAWAHAELAAWYHDAIYDPARPDNEAASADLARDELSRIGIPEEEVAAICALILETVDHELPPAGTASAWLHDSDLWILSAPAERFDDYCRAVRAEYAEVPDEIYARERSHILRTFADRPRIYAEPRAYAEWEPAARANLARELRRLGSR